MLNRTYSLSEVGALIRILLGGNLLSLYLFVQLPNFRYFFGPASMVNPEKFDYYTPSPLFLLWDEPFVLLSLFILLIGLASCFMLGFYARLVHLPLYILHICFHNANPFIIHEPHQLTNLMLVLCFFFPIERAYKLRPSPWGMFFEEVREKPLFWVFRVMLIYVGIYYFFAGIKKLPDPLWGNGKALEVLISWPLLGEENLVTHSLLKLPKLLMVMTYAGLIYEVSFLFMSFVGIVRRWLIPIGIVFHALINLTLDIGHFHMAMWMWYPLLLVNRESLLNVDKLSRNRVG